MLIESDRHHDFPVAPAEFWRVLGDVDAWPDWWPWLRDFTGGRLETGARWRGRVKPPLPYSLEVRIHVVEAVEPVRIVTTIDGDITGTARLDVIDQAQGCQVRLRASLGPAQPALRVLSGLAPGVARFGHDWVLDNGARQFRDQAF